MLILIGLGLIFLDIPIGTVDVIPDLIGYLLIIPGFYIVRKKWHLPYLFLLLNVLALICYMIVLIGNVSVPVEIGLYIPEILCQLLMLLTLVKALSTYLPRDEEPLKTRLQIVRTMILYVGIVDLFLPAIAALSTVAGVILQITVFPAFLFILYHLWRLAQRNA